MLWKLFQELRENAQRLRRQSVAEKQTVPSRCQKQEDNLVWESFLKSFRLNHNACLQHDNSINVVTRPQWRSYRMNTPVLCRRDRQKEPNVFCCSDKMGWRNHCTIIVCTITKMNNTIVTYSKISYSIQ